MKMFLAGMMLFVAAAASAQSLDDIAESANSTNTLLARQQIDKFLADKKNADNDAAWYLKGYIYNKLSRDAATSISDAGMLKQQSFEAFQRYQQLDKEEARLKEDKYVYFFDIYLGYYDLGARQYDAKDYAGAFKSFEKAQQIENFILSKKYTNDEVRVNALDTGLTINLAAAALSNGDTLSAIAAYKRISDANIGGKDYMTAYEIPALYYGSRGDQANYSAALAKGRARYPNSPYWSELEVTLLSSGDKETMFNKYEQIYAANPENFNTTYNYAVELFNYLYAGEKKATDSVRAAKLTQVLKSAISIDEGIDAGNLMMNHMFNQAVDVSAQAALINDKGATPAQLQRKKTLMQQTVVRMDETIPYIEKVIAFYQAKPSMTTREKINLQQAFSDMSEIYTYKKNPTKAAEYDKMREAIKF